jgi:enamine deaminase RidA (YjgF/YER057c/UK114 family)
MTSSARRSDFGTSKPASTLIEVSRFVSSDYLLEIEAVAVKPE